MSYPANNQQSEAASGPAGMPGAGPPLPPFPPGVFPEGENPETYKLEVVNDLLERADYISLFSVPNPEIPNIPIPAPGNPKSLIGIKVYERLHRFDITGESSTLSKGLRFSNIVGEPAAEVRIRWLVIPDDFEAGPDREPPPTPLDPTRPQRFAMMDGEFRFDDADKSGFHGFGAGQTFPVVVGGQPRLRLGAVVDILEGFGQLKGFKGNVVVNGYITPPDGLALGMMVRLMDAEELIPHSGLSGITPIPDPDPTTTFVVLHGEVDPDRPVTLNTTPDGRVVGSNLHERLRLVSVSFDIGTSKEIRTEMTKGQIVGRLSTTTFFDPFSQQDPIPIQTRNGVFTFFDRKERTIGTLKANIIEGRVFKTEVSGAPTPLLRVCGFGPFIEGTGQFSGVDGMLSMNSAISLFPRTLSMLYRLRIIDPDGKFRAGGGQAWS